MSKPLVPWIGGKVDGQVFGTATTAPPKLRLVDLKEELDRSWPRLSMAVIEHLSWEVYIEKYDRPHTLFFMDPPYYETGGYGVEFGLEEYDRMAGLLRAMKGKAIVTVNDHPCHDDGDAPGMEKALKVGLKERLLPK